MGTVGRLQIRAAEQQLIHGIPNLRLAVSPPTSFGADAAVNAALQTGVSNLGSIFRHIQANNAARKALKERLAELEAQDPRDEDAIAQVEAELAGIDNVTTDLTSHLQEYLQQFGRFITSLSNMSSKWDKTVATAISNMKA